MPARILVYAVAQKVSFAGDRHECWASVQTRPQAGDGETLLFRLPVGDVRQRGRQRLRGRHRHLPRHALAGRLEHGAPGLLGALRTPAPQKLEGAAWGSAAGRSCTSEPSAGPSPGWCSSRRARWACAACRSGPAPSRESLSQ